MVAQRKKRYRVTEVLREKIQVDVEEGDIVFETVEEILAPSIKTRRDAGANPEYSSGSR